MKIEVVCSYCQHHITWKECAYSNIEEFLPHPVSHGICPKCFKIEMDKIDSVIEILRKK